MIAITAIRSTCVGKTANKFCKVTQESPRVLTQRRDWDAHEDRMEGRLQNYEDNTTQQNSPEKSIEKAGSM